MKKRKYLFLIILTVILVIGISIVGKNYIYPYFFKLPYAKKIAYSNLSGQKVAIQSYLLRVNLYLNDVITVKYIVPVDEKNRPLKSASNVVFYAPYNGDHGERVEEIKWVTPFVYDYGYSLFSFSIENSKDIVSDREKYYIYPEANWHTVIKQMHKQLIQDFGLEERPLIAVGQSSGGSLIQHILVSEPTWIDIAAWCGGTRYMNWTQKSDAKILALSTFKCYGTKNSDIMTQELLQLGGDIWRGYTPVKTKNDFHSIGKEGQRLVQLFVRDMVARREQQITELTLSSEFLDSWTLYKTNIQED